VKRRGKSAHNVKGLEPPLQTHLDSGKEVKWGRSRQHCSESIRAPTHSRDCDRTSLESVHSAGADADKGKKKGHQPSGPFTNSPQFDARRECVVSVRMSGDVAYGREMAGRPDKRRVIWASDNFRRARAERRLSTTRHHIQVMRTDQQLTHMWPSGPADRPPGKFMKQRLS